MGRDSLWLHKHRNLTTTPSTWAAVQHPFLKPKTMKKVMLPVEIPVLLWSSFLANWKIWQYLGSHNVKKTRSQNRSESFLPWLFLIIVLWVWGWYQIKNNIIMLLKLLQNTRPTKYPDAKLWLSIMIKKPWTYINTYIHTWEAATPVCLQANFFFFF